MKGPAPELIILCTWYIGTSRGTITPSLTSGFLRDFPGYQYPEPAWHGTRRSGVTERGGPSGLKGRTQRTHGADPADSWGGPSGLMDQSIRGRGFEE